MKNIIKARVEFYFKGNRHSLAATIDLDECMRLHDGIPSLFDVIARENAIDAYSYEYEVMLQEDIEIEHAEGFVTDFIHQGVLDADGFAQKWREDKVLSVLREIAKRNMSVDDLNAHPALKNALFDAYQAGLEKT